MSNEHHRQGPPVGFSSWALNAAAIVETVVPGSTMLIMRSTRAGRQARCMALATLERPAVLLCLRDPSRARDRLGDALQRVARLVQIDDPAEIVAEIAGSVPNGFLSTLDRFAPEPLDNPRAYQRLFDAFAAQDPRAKVLSQVPGQLKSSMIEGVLALDELTLHPILVEGLRDLREAHRLNAGIALVRRACSTVTDDEIRQSVLSGKASSKPREWLEDLLLARMDTCARPHPIADDDPIFEALTLGSAFKAASLKMENCLRQRAVFAAMGKAAYSVSRDRKIALELRPLQNTCSWLVTEALGVGNRCLSDEEQRQCAVWFAERGLCYVASPAKADQELLDALGVYDMEFSAFTIEA